MAINNNEKLIADLKYRIAELSRGITERKKKIIELNKQLSKLTGEDGLPWTEKSVECITLFNEVVTSDDILKCIFSDRLYDLEDTNQRRKYITGLSVALNKLCKSGKLKSIKKAGIRGLLYGLPEWWNEKNELDTYYKYTLLNKIENKKPPASTRGK